MDFIDKYYSDASPEAQQRLIENWEGCKTIIRESILSQCQSAYRLIQICVLITVICFIAYAILYKKSIFVMKHKNANSKGAVLLKIVFFGGLFISMIAFIMLMVWNCQFKSITGFDFWQFQ